MRSPTVLSLVALVIALISSARLNASAPEGEVIWWEGESATLTNMQTRSEPLPGGAALSEGQWTGFDGVAKAEPYFAEYLVDVPEAATYRFYARKFWKHGPFRYRFDDQPWARVEARAALLDDDVIRPHLVVNWVSAGEVTLPAGRHTLRIEVDADSKAGFFDCFLLTTRDFFPMGKQRPDRPLPAPAEGFSTIAPYDTLFAPSPIDLRGLNEQVAGERGFIGAEGGHFVQAGKPIRFLAVGANSEVIAMPRDQVRMLAKFLARKGVNLVRYHSPVAQRGGPAAGAIDEREIDNLLYFVEALKREGIFTHLSIYFPVWFRFGESGRFAGTGKNDISFALQFFNPDMQAMQRDWWRALLTRKSPYSGLTLAEDPAIMGVEILNEDSFFFWTFSNQRIPAPQMALLETQFAAWAEKKHGSLAQTLAAWGGTAHPRDSLDERRLGLVSLYDLFTGPPTARERDTARFLAETQRAFFDSMYAFIKHDLGFKGLVCGSNWRTANTRVLGALDKWTQLGCDFLDHHGYYGSGRGKDAQGRILYSSRSLSAWDGGLELPFIPAHIVNKPAMVSEYSWLGINNARAEMPLLTAALASQAGMDAMVLFTLASTPAWLATTQPNWAVAAPSSMGLFPSKALVFRLGLVPETAPAARVTVNVNEMMNLAGNDFVDPSANDANRSNEGADASRSRVTLSHLAHGKVSVEFSETAPSSVEMPEVSAFHDDAAGALRSVTGDIEWLHKRGIFTVRAPQTQAVSGKLAQAGEIELPDLVVNSPLEYGVVWATAMDGLPLASSRKILLQAMSSEQNHGFRSEPVADKPGQRVVVDMGRAPIEIRNIEGTVSFKRADAAGLRATALDINGVPVGPAGAADRLVLQPGVLHYLIEPSR